MDNTTEQPIYMHMMEGTAADDYRQNLQILLDGGSSIKIGKRTELSGYIAQ